MPNQYNSDSIRAQGLHPDAYLSNFGISYMQSQKMFVADQVFPRVPVDYENDIYPIWESSEDFRIDDDDAPRRPGAESSELEVSKSDGQYRAQGYAKHVVLPDREVNQGKPRIDLQTEKLIRLSQRMLALREKRCARIALAAVPADNKVDLAGGGQHKWSVGDSDPFADLTGLQLKVKNAIGFVPNRMLVPETVAMYLRQHPKFIDRFKSWTNTTESIDLPERILGMKPVIARAQYNTQKRNPGKQQAGTNLTLSFFWGDNVILYYEEDDQAAKKTKDTLTSFKTFHVVSSSGVYTWYEPRRRSEVIEQEDVLAEVVTAAPTTGALLNVI